MTCPHCGGATKVVDSRPTEDSVQRRRECLTCKQRFSTTEVDLQLYTKLASTFSASENKNISKATEYIKKSMEEIANDKN